MAFQNQTVWHPTTFRPFEYQTSLVFSSPLYTILILMRERNIKSPSCSWDTIPWLIFWWCLNYNSALGVRSSDPVRLKKIIFVHRWLCSHDQSWRFKQRADPTRAKFCNRRNLTLQRWGELLQGRSKLLIYTCSFPYTVGIRKPDILEVSFLMISKGLFR